MTANSEEATVSVRGLDLFVTVMRLGSTLRRIWVQLPLDEWPETTSHQERQDNSLRHIKSCTIRRTWSWLSTSSSSSSTSPTSSSQETVTDTEIPATRRSESASEDTSARGNSWHEPQIKVTTRELQDDELQGVLDWLQEFKEGLIDESFPEHRDFQFCPALKEEKVSVTSGKKKASVRKETVAVSATKPKIVRKNQNTLPPHFLSQPLTRSKCVE